MSKKKQKNSQAATPKQIVMAVVFAHKEQSVVFQERFDKKDGILYMPSGKIEPGELPFEAVERELKEEINLMDKFDIGRFLANVWSNGKEYSVHAFVSVIDSIARLKNNERGKHFVMVIPMQQLPNINMGFIEKVVMCKALTVHNPFRKNLSRSERKFRKELIRSLDKQVKQQTEQHAAKFSQHMQQRTQRFR